MTYDYAVWCGVPCECGHVFNSHYVGGPRHACMLLTVHAVTSTVLYPCECTRFRPTASWRAALLDDLRKTFAEVFST